MRQEIIELIFTVAKQKNAFDTLERFVSKSSKQTLSTNLIECGILPEMFSHDSSEEKLWAKFSDILLAQSLNLLGINSEVLGTRGNSADVLGRTSSYTIVGDAKTFRLSRTAKNQKDFKVSALDTWRKENNYAVLVAPLLQYPNRKSQIYAQAIARNVTLLSYTHLHFLIDFYNGQDLRELWETGKFLSVIDHQLQENSEIYWNEIDSTVCRLASQNLDKLKEYKLLEIQKTKQVGLEGIAFWENKIKHFSQLTKEEAIMLLIKAEKITVKIKTIEKAINVKVKL